MSAAGEAEHALSWVGRVAHTPPNESAAPRRDAISIRKGMQHHQYAALHPVNACAVTGTVLSSPDHQSKWTSTKPPCPLI
jgi:hypothetical protein